MSLFYFFHVHCRSGVTTYLMYSYILDSSQTSTYIEEHSPPLKSTINPGASSAQTPHVAPYCPCLGSGRTSHQFRVLESAVHISKCVQYDSMTCNPPGSSVHGIFQARILEWVAISFSRGYSRPRDPTRISCVSSIGR